MSAFARDSALRSEALLLAIILAADAVFFFFLIPVGIIDPDGFGLNEGLPPSFSAKVVAGLIALVVLIRVARLARDPGLPAADAKNAAEDAASETESVPETGWRTTLGAGTALVFAFAAAPLLGYYIASFFLIAILMRAMGETRWLRLLGQPAIVVGMIWILFDNIFSIRLPVGILWGE